MRSPRVLAATRCAALLLLAAVVVGGPALPARAAPAEDPIAVARRVAVAKLEALATWCDGNKMPGERDRTFRRILELDPDHARSRAGLHYKRANRSSPWVQSDYVEPADWDKSLLGEAKKRRIAAARAFRDAASEAFDAAGVPADDPRRDQAVEISLQLAPEDVEFRKEQGDVEDGSGWILPETVEGRRRRREFQAMLAPLPPGRFVEDADALVKNWTGGALSDHFSTYGHVPTEECLEEVRLRERGLVLLQALLGPVTTRKDLHPLILFPGYRTARRFLESRPEYAPLVKESEMLGSMPLEDGNYASWQEPAPRRVVGLRNLISFALRGFVKDGLRPWAVEGVGQRVCRLVAGRHGASFCNVAGTDRPGEDEDDRGDLDPGASWLPLAAVVLRHDPVRRLRAVLTMNLNAMHRSDVLVAYALGAYLIEGRPDGLKPLVAATARTDDADGACRAALGVDCATLVRRVRRWAAEAGDE